MKFINQIFFILLLGVSSIYSQADEGTFIQEPSERRYSLGGYVGYGLNFHFADFNELPGVRDCCPKYTSAFGSGFDAGILFDLPLNNNSALDFRLGYMQLNGDFLVTQSIGNVALYPPTGPPEIKSAVAEHNIISTLAAINFNATYNYMLNEKWSVLGGLNFAYLSKGEFDLWEELKEPEGFLFDNGKLIRNENYEQQIQDLNVFQIFITAGAGYKIPINDKLSINPEVRYNFPLLNITSVDWKVSKLSLIAALKYDIYPPRYIPTIRDTIIYRDTLIVENRNIIDEIIEKIETDKDEITEELPEALVIRTIYKETYRRTVPRASKLTAKITGEILAVNNIVIEENETEESYPILPQIFFDEGKADLKTDYYNLLTREEAKNFTEANLKHNTLGIYENILNVMGRRLVENPNTKITIAGFNNNAGVEKGNLALSKNRADIVKAYLVDVWGINPNRISIKNQNLPDNPGKADSQDGLEENRRIDIQTNDLELVKPILIREIVKKSNPPIVQLASEITHDEDVSDVVYDLAISQSGNDIRHWQGKGEGDSYEWVVTESPAPELETPIDITLYAKDAYGTTAFDKKSTQIKQLTIKKKRYELKDDKRIEKFALIVFDYDKSNLTRGHQAIIDDIKSRIEPNSVVTIKGYTDRTGDPEYNKQLAGRRVQEVKNALKLNNVMTEAIGSEELLYDNSTPQGRSFCRTVLINIETPITN